MRTPGQATVKKEESSVCKAFWKQTNGEIKGVLNRPFVNLCHLNQSSNIFEKGMRYIYIIKLDYGEHKCFKCF